MDLSPSSISENLTRFLNKHCDGIDKSNVPLMIIYFPIILLALVANLLVIVIVIKFRDMRYVTNYFLINLAIADLLVTLICMPQGMYSAYTIEWPFDEIACKFAGFLQGTAVASSVFTITAMALDRYFAITKPFGVCKCFTKRTTVIIILGMWFCSIVLFSPKLVVAQVDRIEIDVCPENKTFHVCLEQWDRYDWILVVIFNSFTFAAMFAIPGIIILCAYTMMGKKLYSDRPPFDDGNPISTQQSIRLVRERKRVAWILLLLIFIFTFCWLPYNVVIFLDSFRLDSNDYNKQLLLLGHVNSALNPIIYCAMSRNFRKSLRRMFCMGRRSVERGRHIELQERKRRDIYVQLHKTISNLQSSQKTLKTCTV